MSGPTELRTLRVIGALDGLHDALAHRLLVQLVVLVEPLLYRQLAAKSLCSCFSRPGISHCSSTLIGGMKPSMTSFDHVAAHRVDGLGDVRLVQQLVALLVDDLALVVGDVVVLEQLLADIEVAPSTLRWAFSMALVTMRCSMASPFSMPRACIKFLTRSEAKMRIRLSSRDR
jgi:hypothetical protein